MRDKFIDNELYSPRGLLKEKELESLVALCISFNRRADLQNNNPLEVMTMLENIHLENAPQSNLIVKEDIHQRDPGMFSSWTDVQVIMTRDHFVHVYEIPKQKQEYPDYSSPIFSINLPNVSQINTENRNKVENERKLEVCQTKSVSKLNIKEAKNEIVKLLHDDIKNKLSLSNGHLETMIH